MYKNKFSPNIGCDNMERLAKYYLTGWKAFLHSSIYWNFLHPLMMEKKIWKRYTEQEMEQFKTKDKKCWIKSTIYRQNIECRRCPKRKRWSENRSANILGKSVKIWQFIIDISNFGDKSWKQAKMVLCEQKIGDISSIYRGKIDWLCR